MNMKKLMAVVLAVVVAISAMAISVFAETYRIDLDKTSTNWNGKTVTWTFDMSNYSLFGYADQDSYLELRLPTTLTKTDASPESKNTQVDWFVEVGGTRYALKDVAPAFDANSTKGVTYFTQYVNFGALTHSYYNNNGVDNWATIPQSQMVGDITTIRLVAEVTYASNNDDSQSVTEWNGTGFKDNNYDMYVQLWTAGINGVKDYAADGSDDIKVSGSYTNAAFMTVAKSDNQKTATTDVAFISTYMSGDPAWNEGTRAGGFVWDHNLVNRSMIMGAESAKVIVKLKNPTNGVALYTLRTKDQPIGSYDTSGETDGMNPWPGYNSWNNPADTEIASTCVVNGEVSELVFEVPLDKLYNATYGVFNGGMWITERITLDEFQQQNNTWFYNGKQIHYETWATDVYIELTMPELDDEDQIEVEDPIEAGDVEDEEDNIEVEDPVDQPEDTNPPTGIVLAVLPMAIAAAAVVASKRR